VLLQLFEPRLNKQGSNWGSTQEYLQYVPSEHGGGEIEIGDQLAELATQVGNLRQVIEGNGRG
jgi:hypothetical protein